MIVCVCGYQADKFVDCGGVVKVEKDDTITSLRYVACPKCATVRVVKLVRG